MRRRRFWRPRNLLIGGFGLLLAIQLLPVWLLQTNPSVVAEPTWDRPQTRSLAQRACFDCHSNETQWPLYTRIAPVSWLVTFDVLRGRRELNFSTWGAAGAGGEGQRPFGGDRGDAGRPGRPGDSNACAGVADSARAGNRAAGEVVRGSMPPSSYLLIHPEARLTDAEKQQLVEGLCASLK
jgi:hypothetical protein